MIRNGIFIKSITFFLLLETLFNIVAPSISWALTAGPTAPEATTFEPVDTTDVVDLKTGDFNYNIPLLEIPGPAGSYPLTLSHHSNIQLNQEASWVGSSWNLNPGAITRFVSGYPDDHNGIHNVNRDFWEGGSTETYTIGVSVGVANGVSVGASLSFANDTYRGYGVGVMGTAGIGMGTAGIGMLSVQAGSGPYGTSSGSVTVSGGYQSNNFVRYSGSASISLNSNSGLNAGAGTGVSVGGASLMDASISTDMSGNSSSRLGIVGKVNNSKAGRISVEEDNFQVEIPIYMVNLRLGRNYQRYWIDETENVSTFGTLYGKNQSPGYTSAFDTYDILDTNLSSAYHDDPESVLGGTFPDVDSYTVTAQGLGGAIRPMFYRKQVFRQDKKIQNEEITKSYPLSALTGESEPDFRFVNDFSNQLEYTPPDFTVSGSTLEFQYSGQLSTGETGTDGYVNGRLAGSRHIRWYKNSDILSPDPALRVGLVKGVVEGFTRNDDSQIGAFSITNESGVTYHYALPAYSYDEIVRSQNTVKQQETNGLYYNHLSKPEKYAYTWYLTSLTGPDFIDRNSNGIADDGDWGYWVRFEYAKWLGDYRWRNPGEEFNKDIDEFDFFSAGRKEVYYLDKVFTQSHVAVFKKSPRLDSREVSDLLTGGFSPQTIAGQTVIPRPCLKLDEIVLYSSKDYVSQTNSIRSIKFEYDYSLALGTPNSYSNEDTNSKLGKLTLKSVKFLGKNGADLLPITSFEYKNATYNKEYFDSWGYYKSDYVDTGNQNLDRLTSEISSQDVDAWSLTRIKTALGSSIEVEYESDRYVKPALYRRNVFSVNTVSLNAANHSIVVEFKNGPQNLQSYQDIIGKSEMNFLFRRNFKSKAAGMCYCDGWETPPEVSMGNYYDVKSISLSPSKIESISASTIEFKDDALYDFLGLDGVLSTYTESPCITASNVEFNPQIEIAKPVVVSGNLFYNPESEELYGGGSRVKRVRIGNFDETDITSYNYNGGVTTYEPIGLGRIDFNFENWLASTWPAEQKRIKAAKNNYQTSSNGNFSNLLTISRELPGPGVIYGKVLVDHEKVFSGGVAIPSETYSEFEFEVFSEGMIGIVDTNVASHSVSGMVGLLQYSQINTRKVVLKDFTSRIGGLRAITVYSRNGKPLSKSENIYLHDGLDGSFNENVNQYEPEIEDQYSNQGVLNETAVRARVVKYSEGAILPYGPNAGQYLSESERHLNAVISKKESYPSLLLGQKSTNYKTGITTSIKNLSFDFYSGKILKTENSDGYGNTYVTEVVPAYKVYPAMGVIANGGKNMLVQEASSYSYKIDDNTDEKVGLVSAAVQTWSDQVPVLEPKELLMGAEAQPGVWRKHASFLFRGANQMLQLDGLYSLPDNNLPIFTAWNRGELVSDEWAKVNELTLYDVHSHALETNDINEQFAATKFSMDQLKVVANAFNARFEEFGYSGAESRPVDGVFGTEVTQNSVIYAPVAHTGSKALSAAPSARGFTFFLTPQNKTYHVSVWSSQPSCSFKYKLNGNPQAITAVTKTIGQTDNWFLLEADIKVVGSYNSMEIWCEATESTTYFDDFRFHPLEAAMTSYVYNQWGELSHILDNNNLYTEYEYDQMGRLKHTYKESFQFDRSKTSSIDYHYAGQE